MPDSVGDNAAKTDFSCEIPSNLEVFYKTDASPIVEENEDIKSAFTDRLCKTFEERPFLGDVLNLLPGMKFVVYENLINDNPRIEAIFDQGTGNIAITEKSMKSKNSQLDHELVHAADWNIGISGSQEFSELMQSCEDNHKKVLSFITPKYTLRSQAVSEPWSTYLQAIKNNQRDTTDIEVDKANFVSPSERKLYEKMAGNVGEKITLDNSKACKQFKQDFNCEEIIITASSKKSVSFKPVNKLFHFVEQERKVNKHIKGSVKLSSKGSEMENAERLAYMLGSRSPEVTNVLCPELVSHFREKVAETLQEKGWVDREVERKPTEISL